MQLYFIRHGESEANRQRIISNRDLPHPLTRLGREQAAGLARSLSDAGIQVVYASPIPRAAETAHILASAWRVPLRPTTALREFDCGIAEGRGDAQAWELHNRVWRDWQEHGLLDNKIPGGESFNDMRDRFVPFVEGLVKDGAEQTIAMVGHGSLFINMLPLILVNITSAQITPLGFPNTGYVLAEPMPEGLVCRKWCEMEFPV